MNPEIKDQWVRALREETWKQGFGMLYSPERKLYTGGTKEECWCALGVLAELAVQNGVLQAYAGTLSSDTGDGTRAAGERFGEPEADSFLPAPVAEWAEINTSEQYEVVRLNDRGGKDYSVSPPADIWTFTKVADWVEENL